MNEVGLEHCPGYVNLNIVYRPTYTFMGVVVIGLEIIVGFNCSTAVKSLKFSTRTNRQYNGLHV